MRRILVIGAGITGLAAAWEASADSSAQVTVIDASSRLGGLIKTSPVPGLSPSMPIDEGADAFLARVDDAVDLCRELGLDDELTEPAAGRAKVFVNDELKFFPTDAVLGVPLQFEPLEKSGLLSPSGVERARQEVERDDWAAPTDDVSIGGFLTERYGRELVDNVVGPLIGGINAGDVDRLSLRAVTPQLAAAADDGGSLTLALRRRSSKVAAGPIFNALVGGTGRLIEALGEQLDDRGVEIHPGVTALDCSIGTVEGGNGEQVLVRTNKGTVHFDRVIICTPASVAAELLSNLSLGVARELRSIAYSSVALVTLIYRRQALNDDSLDASGFLIPRNAQMLMTAASIGSSKWAHWNDGEHVVMRVSAGHSADERGVTLTDTELLDGLAADLARTLRPSEGPVGSRISRWRSGFAQYEVGHLERIERIESQMAEDCPLVSIAGASYHGVGIPACVRQGRSKALWALS